jgi:thiamine biosynthesis lipoprotein ApbE
VSPLAVADDRALGGSVRVIVTRPERLAAAKAAVDRCLRDIDQAASRFREDSELSRLNAMPETEVRVSALLARAIGEALRGARLTGGAVDPTVGHAVRLSGYDGDFAGVAADGLPLELVVRKVPGWQAVHFDPGVRAVRVPRGVELDLGATAKALASDLCVTAALDAAGGGGVLVSLGGDIAVAGEPPPGGWLIQVSEDSGAPIAPGEETVAITAGGMATSSTTVRRWTRGGVELHHIIDPTTGLPAAGRWRTATVVAANCVDANIGSTAAIVMGAKAPAWLEAAGLPGRLVDRSGAVRRTAGWPVPDGPPSRLSANTQESGSRFSP